MPSAGPDLSTSDLPTFGGLVLLAAAIGLLAVLSNRLSERVRVPTLSCSWSPPRSAHT